jgi:dCMP deaminase
MIRDTIMSPRDPRHGAYRGRDPFSACNCLLLLSGDNDLLPAAEMVGNYGIDVAIFRPVDDHDSRQNPVHPRIHTYRTFEDDLKQSMLPDCIPREDGPAITWSEYLTMKIASEAVSPEVDRECLAQCHAEAANSDDTETTVGCVVRNPKGDIIVKGHNALPFGVQRTPPERLSRPDKYAWIEHAERNAIYAAARSGTSLRHCTMYVELMPCADCARGIIQSGIKEVVVSQDRMQGYANSAYREQHVIATALLTEAGVRLRAA